MPSIYYKGDVPKADQLVIEEFVRREEEHPLKPLPLCSVLELPNKHKYQYTPIPGAEEYTYNFERIETWP